MTTIAEAKYSQKSCRRSKRKYSIGSFPGGVGFTWGEYEYGGLRRKVSRVSALSYAFGMLSRRLCASAFTRGGRVDGSWRYFALTSSGKGPASVRAVLF